MTTKINVLHVIHSLYGGGAETQLRILCQTGIEHNIDSTTFCIDGGRDDLIENRKVISYQRKSKLDFGIYKAIKSAIKEVDADIVHAWLPPVVTVPAVIAAKISGVPVITSYRSAKEIRSFKDIVEYMVCLSASSGIASNTPVELCSFPYQWLHNIKHGVVIPNAVIIPEQMQCKNIQSEAGDDLFKILFVGRISSEKNWECLIRAVGKIRNGLPWRLTICGKGPDEKQLLEEIKRYRLEEKIQVLGFRDNIYKVMKSHDVLVLPSWYEGVPNVLFEAFAVGLPAIISDIPSHKNIVAGHDVALTFPPDSPDSLCSKLEQLGGDINLRSQLSENACEFVKDFEPVKMAKAYKQYYAQLVDSCTIK